MEDVGPLVIENKIIFRRVNIILVSLIPLMLIIGLFYQANATNWKYSVVAAWSILVVITIFIFIIVISPPIINAPKKIIIEPSGTTFIFSGKKEVKTNWDELRYVLFIEKSILTGEKRIFFFINHKKQPFFLGQESAYSLISEYRRYNDRGLPKDDDDYLSRYESRFVNHPSLRERINMSERRNTIQAMVKAAILFLMILVIMFFPILLYGPYTAQNLFVFCLVFGSISIGMLISWKLASEKGVPRF